MVRILWQDDKGKPVPTRASRPPRAISSATPATAEAEHPLDKGTDANGWTEVSDTYRRPAKATQAVVELHLLWAPGGQDRVGRRLARRSAARPRRERSGWPPSTSGPRASRRRPTARSYAPLIAEAAKQKADLVVLGETLTYLRHSARATPSAPSRSPAPRPKYFGELAKKHNLYIVAGLLERDGHLVYNVAVLIGPDGQHRRQVSQGLPAARRDRRRASRPATTTRSSTRASASSA